MNIALFSALQEAFDEFDKDRDGYITSSELMEVMTSLRQNVSDKEIHQMIRSVDTDGSINVFIDVWKSACSCDSLFPSLVCAVSVMW